MQIDSDGCVIPTGFPAALLPGLGYVAIQHAQLDHAINETIWFLAGVDANAGTAITSPVFNIGTRMEMLRRLATVTIPEGADQEKVHAIIDRASELTILRNRVTHNRPYWTDPVSQEAGFFRAENLTRPQIKIQPPVKISAQSLDELGTELMMLTIWLGMYRAKHPDWSDDSRFPWRTKLPQRTPANP